jgi:tetratricopeptide (TPR) repeat protein
MEPRGGTADVRRASAAIEDAKKLAASEPGEALERLEGAISAPLRRLDPTLTARASYLKAQLLCERGDYDAALGSVRSARRDWLAAGRRLEALRTDLGKATILHELGEYRQAISVSDGLLGAVGVGEVTESGPSVASIRARAHNNLGNAWMRLGDHQRALRHYDVAANLFYGLDDEAMRAMTDANRGLAYLKLGMAHRALDELRRAERALDGRGLRLPAAKCSMDIAEAHLHLGQIGAAISVLGEIREVLEDLDAVPELARLSTTLGNALLRAQLPLAARIEARKAADIFAELSMVDDSGRATYLCGLASLMLGEPMQAAAELAAAARLFADCGSTGHEARVWLTQAQLVRRSGKPEVAMRLAVPAVERLEEIEERVPAIIGRLLLASLSDDATEVERHLRTAEEQAATLGLAALSISIELARARHHRRQGRLEEAAALLRRTLLTTPPDAGMLASGDAELSIALEGTGSDAYDELIDILLEQSTQRSHDEAWQWAALARGRALADAAGRRGERLDGPPAGRPLRTPLADDLELLLGGPPGQGVAGDGDGLPPLPEGPLLQYYVLGADVVAFVVREGQVYVRRLPQAVASVVALTNVWQLECARLSSAARDHGQEPAGDPAMADSVLRELHRLLVEPVGDLLEDVYGLPLLVVAHQQLWVVPFEALHGGGEPFSARHALVFAPGTYSPTGADAASPEAGSTVVLAVPDEVAPRIAEEAARVVELRPGAELRTGAEADSASFLRRAPGPEILHLACHGSYDPSNPFRSGLRLSDRWVTASEVMEMDLAGTLVVLSACAAGRTSTTTPEPAGMAWAFLAAGCRAVIASSWTVEDDAALELVSSLYERLAEGASPRDALARARADLARRRRHPYYWASFRLTCSPEIALTEGLSL